MALLLAACLFSGVAMAQRPSAPKLLPEDTLAYMRIGNTKDLVKKFQQTSLGRIANDEAIKPLIGSLYGIGAEAFTAVSDQVGLSLDKILALPQGELCVALVKSENNMDLAILIEVKGRIADAKKLIAKGEAQLIKDGGSKVTETIGATKVSVYKALGEDRRMTMFDRQGVIVFTSDIGVARQIIETWDGDSDARTLVTNRKFTTIMRRSVGTKEEPPQISWYVDPIELVRAATKGNLGAQAFLGVLPVLGLDGFKGLGGTIIMAPKEFDSIFHLHILLDSPPQGLLTLLTFGNEDMKPEAWVPKDIASYASFNWKPKESYAAIEKVYDSFRGAGSLKADVINRGSNALGVELKEEIIDQLQGRFTMVTRIEEPIRINSQASMFAAMIKDPRKVTQSLEKVFTRFQVFKKKTYKGVTYFEMENPGIRRARQGQDIQLRQQSIILAVLGDYLVFTDSVRFLNRAVNTKAKPNTGITSALDYKLIASRVKRQLGRNKPSMIGFDRPEEGLRMMYTLATSDGAQQFLDRGAENNDFLKSLNSAVKDNPLPAFEEIAKYLSPSGSVLTADATGLHLMGFTLKREVTNE